MTAHHPKLWVEKWPFLASKAGDFQRQLHRSSDPSGKPILAVHIYNFALSYTALGLVVYVPMALVWMINKPSGLLLGPHVIWVR